MIRVKATREGLVGKTTAADWVIDKEYPFVALPSRKALFNWVKIYNPLNGKMCCAQVLDVGPFNTNDDKYVFQLPTNGTDEPQAIEVRPKSEIGISISNIGTNGSGIDLGEKVWELLGMKDNTQVMWEFVTPRPGQVNVFGSVS